MEEGVLRLNLSSLLGVAALVGAVAVACSGGDAVATPTPQSTSTGEATATATPATVQVAPTPEVQALRLGIAVSDLAVGDGNRVAFALIGPEGPIKVPSASAQFTFLGGDSGRAIQVAAIFRSWPVGPGGVFSTIVDFDQAGQWGMEVRVFLPGGVIGVGRTQLSVATASASPALGARPPASKNKTLSDLDDPANPEELATITSSEEPDADLYRLTVAEALDSGLPSVVSFASPAFCQTATCGPQVEVISAVKEQVAGAANFIHIEVYDSPHQLTDLSRARLVPQMVEWGLLSEPFTFILDREGRVAAKFEGFVNEDELAAALQSVLGS